MPVGVRAGVWCCTMTPMGRGPADADAATVGLRPVDGANRAAVETLAVTGAQSGFVDGVRESLAEAERTPALHPWTRAVYADDVPVGFLMVADDVPDHVASIPWRYYLWRMLIDRRHQGRGYGRAALDHLRDHLRDKPGADWLYTSVVPGTGSPLGFYRSCGFEETGEWFDHELVLRLPLAPGPTAGGTPD
jgi:diamine N-acetyltransferase